MSSTLLCPLPGAPRRPRHGTRGPRCPASSAAAPPAPGHARCCAPAALPQRCRRPVPVVAATLACAPRRQGWHCMHARRQVSIPEQAVRPHGVGDGPVAAIPPWTGRHCRFLRSSMPRRSPGLCRLWRCSSATLLCRPGPCSHRVRPQHQPHCAPSLSQAGIPLWCVSAEVPATIAPRHLRVLVRRHAFASHICRTCTHPGRSRGNHLPLPVAARRRECDNQA